MPDADSIRTEYTPGAASGLGSTRNDADRPGPLMAPGAGDGSTRVNDAGRVEITRAPSPRLRPTAVKVKGRPISAPRGFNSVITGPAAIAAWAARANAHA